MLEAAIIAPGVKGNDFAYAFEIALAYDHLGEKKKALDYLERSERSRTHGFNLAEPDPRLADLRKEPRFQLLLQKLRREL